MVALDVGTDARRERVLRRRYTGMTKTKCSFFWKRVRTAIGWCAPVAGCLLGGPIGCSSSANPSSGGPATPSSSPTDPTGTTGNSGTSQNTGSVGFQLVLAGGDQINTIDWQITGPNGATALVQSGAVAVQSLGAQFLVGSIPSGSGYRVTLSGASDAGVQCSGSAQFNVSAESVSHVGVQLQCSASGTGGQGTTGNGTTFDCAAWDSVTANPLEATVGQSVALAATASGPNPSLLTYAWSAPSGSFSAAGAATSTFTCTEVGPVLVTLTVGDGAVPAGSTCNPAETTNSFTVTCDATDGGVLDAGSDAGPPPPPRVAPAIPPAGLALLGGALAAIAATVRKRPATNSRRRKSKAD